MSADSMSEAGKLGAAAKNIGKWALRASGLGMLAGSAYIALHPDSTPPKDVSPAAGAITEVAITSIANGEVCEVVSIDKSVPGKLGFYFTDVPGRRDGHTNPPPDRYDENSPLAQDMVKNVKDNAVFMSTLDKGDVVALSALANGGCLVNVIKTNLDGTVEVVHGVLDKSGKMGELSPSERLPAAVKDDLINHADYTIKGE